MGSEIFYSRALTPEQLDRTEMVKMNFTQLFNYLDSEIPSGREKSLYKTKLEEACMWAVKAISREEIEVID